MFPLLLETACLSSGTRETLGVGIGVGVGVGATTFLLYFNYPYPCPDPSCSKFSRLLAFGLLELITPTEDAGLGAMMLSLGLVAALHPNTGHRGVDVDVFRAKCEGLFAGREGFVQLTRREVDLGLSQPSLEAGRIGRHRCLQLRQRRHLIAHGEVERRLVRQG